MASMKIDLVSDVVCPWCVVGLKSLDIALQRLGPSFEPVELSFQPFELNPQMPPEGEDITEHLARKYGLNAEQVKTNQLNIRERAAAVGFDFRMDKRSRTWNTFDTHRLLHWAHEVNPSKQRALKEALFSAYFTEGLNPGSHEVLLRLCGEVGLDGGTAEAILNSDRYATEVREAEAFWQQAGIRSVPAFIINRKHLISGGQPPEVFEQALRQIAAESSAKA
ncbi:MAG: disulfide bond formation protein DsbA [Ideonella sp. MAG2]|nr:MAG: disulfide bond formation protein DsbA [Ideonella sp. MAG2]